MVDQSPNWTTDWVVSKTVRTFLRFFSKYKGTFTFFKVAAHVFSHTAFRPTFLLGPLFRSRGFHLGPALSIMPCLTLIFRLCEILPRVVWIHCVISLNWTQYKCVSIKISRKYSYNIIVKLYRMKKKLWLKIFFLSGHEGSKYPFAFPCWWPCGSGSKLAKIRMERKVRRKRWERGGVVVSRAPWKLVRNLSHCDYDVDNNWFFETQTKQLPANDQLPAWLCDR